MKLKTDLDNQFLDSCNDNKDNGEDRKLATNDDEKLPFIIVLVCYFSYFVLLIFGYLRDFLRNISIEKNKKTTEINRKEYVSLFGQSLMSFYIRNIYRRVSDIYSMPITGVPGARVTVIERDSDDFNWTFRYSGITSDVINMGSYNYLGFAENTGPITDKVDEKTREYGVGLCTTRHELGMTEALLKLEEQTARFLGVPSSLVFGMGFATNSTSICALVNKGSLILSDENNHASIALGCRVSRATTFLFRHNDLKDLEQKIRHFIVTGQPKTNRPWKKILIIVEGIYSMEGTIINLPELIRIKKKYKCYVYLDEAHSIGAIGPKGRGVCDYYGCDPNDIDLLMGTFTKSFGAAGGYIAGKKQVIDHLKSQSYSTAYSNTISPSIIEQISGVMTILLGDDGSNQGQNRIKQLVRNTKYFRRRLTQMGFIIYGNEDSPVVPLVVGFPSKITAVTRLAHKMGVGLICAGYPATPLTECRVRFCISASHTKEMLDKCLEVINEIGDRIGIKYSSRPHNSCEISY